MVQFKTYLVSCSTVRVSYVDDYYVSVDFSANDDYMSIVLHKSIALLFNECHSKNQ